jgi:hypothetical protein
MQFGTLRKPSNCKYSDKGSGNALFKMKTKIIPLSPEATAGCAEKTSHDNEVGERNLKKK